MAYSIYHKISTTFLENTSALDCIRDYINGGDYFTKDEILSYIDSAYKHNIELMECANKITEELSKEIF